LSGFVLDHADESRQEALSQMGLRSLVTGIWLPRLEQWAGLAQEILEFATTSR
jgi:hypothetical protein